jgi:putative flippase GtrA
VLRLRPAWPELRRMAMFGAIGALNTGVDVGLFALLTGFTRLPPGLANVASFGVGAINSYVLNSCLTFAGLRRRTFSAASFARFALVTALCIALSSTAITVAVAWMSPLHAKLLSLLLTFACGYSLHRLYALRDRPAARAPARA